MRTLRIRSAAATATTALVAVLALTACQPDDVVGSNPEPQTTSNSSTDEPASKAPNDSEATGKPQDSTTPDTDSGKNNGGNNSGGGGKGKSSDARTPCTGDNTKVTITEVTRPINHLLVTATNAGGGNCDAYYAPLLGFDDAQSTTQINEDSKPQAVVTLAPGESAYASIALGGDGSPDIAAYKLSVNFSGRDNAGSVGSPANLTLPKGTMISDTTSVSYWQSTMADALTW
ncbi:DUF4232 domain-containing protein [Streptomyces sp. NBC_01511]|uniref:DUF4232 domain-containing protein n=1 Tax=unclassified Streptomyces TaxID=2593676 RepID=UPI00386B8157